MLINSFRDSTYVHVGLIILILLFTIFPALLKFPLIFFLGPGKLINFFVDSFELVVDFLFDKFFCLILVFQHKLILMVMTLRHIGFNIMVVPFDKIILLLTSGRHIPSILLCKIGLKIVVYIFKFPTSVLLIIILIELVTIVHIP